MTVEHAQPGDMFTAPVPRCPYHDAPMRYVLGLDPAPDGAEVTGVYQCPSYGDGCDQMVPGSSLKWTYIGQTAPH
jgi:hypothetical protein